MKSRVHESLLITAMLCIAPGMAIAASFDCAKASTKVEKLICGDATLSKLDEQLARRYDGALKTSLFPAALRDQQRRWLRENRGRCADIACLRSVYDVRSKDFQWKTLQGKSEPICEEFRRYESRKGGLLSYVLEEKETGKDDFNFSIDGVDVDGDGKNDRLLLFRTGSGSIIPADNSTLSLTLSSTGKTFSVDAQRFYVIAYKARIYMLAGAYSEDGPVESEIYSLGSKGVTKLCGFECRVPGGDCLAAD